MIFEPTSLQGVVLDQASTHEDERGFFVRTFAKKNLKILDMIKNSCK